MKIWGFLVCFLLCGTVLCRADEGKRVALVIGNDAYSMRPLRNAVNDARAMDRALRAAGFRTILKENASKKDMEQSFVQMLELLGPDDTALVFYAGHAVQIENENELIPVDFTQASSVIDAKYKAVSLAQVLDMLIHVRHKRTILIVDACRSNPIAEGQSLQAGLAMPLNDSKETYTAFSTSPNHVATDNPNGRNSYFTEALAELIENGKDLTLDDVMTRVRKQVESATEGKQTPWSQTSLSSKFYFHAQANAGMETDVSLVDKWLADAKAREQRGQWVEALDLLNRIVARKPGGAVETEAHQRLPYVSARREARASYDAGKYVEAATAFKQAYEMNRFSTDAALQAVTCYLLADDLDEAVTMVHEVRLRGSSSDVKRSDLLLKAIAPVDDKATAELQAPLPAPPAIGEVFAGFPFGRVDVEHSLAVARNTRVNVTSVLMAALPAAPVVAPTASVATLDMPDPTATPVTLDTLHVEVSTASSSKQRDISIERVNHVDRLNTPTVQREGMPLKVTTTPAGAAISVDGDPELKCDSPCLLTLPASVHMLKISMDGYKPESRDVSGRASGDHLDIALAQEFGFVTFDGQSGNTPVYVDGKMAALQVPSKVKMAAGKYSVRVVEHGKVLSSKEMEVKDSDMLVFKVAGQQQAANE